MLQIGQLVKKIFMFESVDGWMDGWTGYGALIYYTLTLWDFLSGELEKQQKIFVTTARWATKNRQVFVN